MSVRASQLALAAAAIGVGAAAGALLAAGPGPVERLLGLAPAPAQVLVQEVVHGRAGRDALVLREKDGERRIIVSLSPDESRVLSARVSRGASATGRSAPPAATGPATAPGRLLRASIDTFSPERVFSAHLTMERDTGEVEVASTLASAVALAMDRGAPIWMARDVLDRTGVTPEDVRSLADSTRARTKAHPAGATGVLDI